MLTIYRASAGAGKTHKLTGEYLALLFSRPGAYRRILAVTFTNKATDEMKSRIVRELYHLASGRPSDYLRPLSAAYSLTEPQAREQARKILVAILHDYSAFNISTIDRFFQQTTRAFAREIGLPGGYGIEMDQERVLTEAIDRLLADLEKPESKDLLGWLLRFAADKIEEGGGWSLRQDILSLGRELFKERYRAFREEAGEAIADKQALEAYKQELYAIIRSAEAEARRLGEEGAALLKRSGLSPADFKGGSRSPLFYLERLAGGEMKEPTATFRALADHPEAYTTRSTPPDLRQAIGRAYAEGLNACVKRVVSLFADLTAYHTARQIVRYSYTLGILTDISRQIAAYREEKNILLIADTTELLNKVIRGSDAPFIYEKTGTRVDHYMIDEFQDTSGMQWDNFRPLVAESLANGRANLIVGDVKQSIYRFRNSDWTLLDERVRADFRPEQSREETLADNWRSCRRIVDFNNAFFTAAPAILQALYNEALESSSLSASARAPFLAKITDAYDRSRQRVPPPLRQKEGHVRIEFLSGDAEKDWRQEAMERLPAILERLQDNGYALKEIAILARTNQEGARVADTLLAYKEAHPSGRYRYDIISDDALFVSRSPAVRFLIALLRCVRDPEDPTCRKQARYAYQVLTGRFGAREADDEPPLQNLLPLSRQSLYELAEGLFRDFSACFPETEQVFAQAFLDLVAEYAQKESADLSRFLKWWDETGCRKTIATPDGQNAIRVLTVHKSKGLGFKVVILPFADWEIDHKPTKPVILWCHPEERPFDRLRLVPVRYGPILGRTIFAKDYFRERLHAFIDNLNTLYVAFTRAKEELIVCAPRPRKIDDAGKVEKIASIADLLWAGVEAEIEADTFERGEWWHPDPDKASGAAPEEIPMSRLRSVPPDGRLRLRLRGKGFFFDNARRKQGALLHEILSRIRTPEDIPASVERYRVAGVIGREEAAALVGRLAELLRAEEVKAWYDGSARVLNEVEILFGKGLSRRPDRVMIKAGRVTVVDYKFGERQDKRYPEQVRNYLRLIREMGFERVDGYLWYVALGKIEAVNG